MIRRPPRSTQSRASAASDVYKRQVMAQAGAGEEQRALAVEKGRVEGRYRAAGLPEERQRATRAQRVEAFLKRGLADGIVDHIDAAATGEAPRFHVELLLGIKDDFVGAGIARDLRLLHGGNGAQDAGAKVLGHLHRQSAGAARVLGTVSTVEKAQ